MIRLDKRHHRTVIGVDLATAAFIAAVYAPGAVGAGESQVYVDSGELFFVARGDVENDVQVVSSGDGDNLIVSDANIALIAGVGCLQLDPHTASCPAEGVTTIDMRGRSGNDRLTNLTDLPATLRGGPGNDSLRPGHGADSVLGGSGEDTADYSGAISGVQVSLSIVTEQPTGGSGDDTIKGVENLVGSDFGDFLTGSNADNRIEGRGGVDQITPRLGADDVSGGDDIDFVDYTKDRDGVNVTLDGVADDGAPGEGDNVRPDVEAVFGGRGPDTLVGNSGLNGLLGGAGADVMVASGGDDVFVGEGGVDTVDFSGAPGPVSVDLRVAEPQDTGFGMMTLQAENVVGSSFADSLIGSGKANFVDGGPGDDYIFPRGGSDTIVGGSGVDMVDFSDHKRSSSISLDDEADDGSPGEADNIRSDVENVRGGPGHDHIVGSAAANILEGRGGNDVLEGGQGDDSLIGGGGTDVASYESAPVRVEVDLSINEPQETGGAGLDTLTSVEDLAGSDFDDLLRGNGKANTIRGGAGRDSVSGKGGDDLFLLRDGERDTAVCGAGIDIALVDADDVTDCEQTAEKDLPNTEIHGEVTDGAVIATSNPTIAFTSDGTNPLSRTPTGGSEILMKGVPWLTTSTPLSSSRKRSLSFVTEA